MAFDLESLYKSLIRHTVATIEDVRENGVSIELEYYAWDQRGEEAEIASKDLLGLAGWTFRENRGLWIVHTGLTLSTYNDEHLMREVQIIDRIHNMWGEDQVIPMVDKDTGEEYTQLVVSEFEIMAPGQSEKRNYRPIGIQLNRTSNG